MMIDPRIRGKNPRVLRCMIEWAIRVPDDDIMAVANEEQAQIREQIASEMLKLAKSATALITLCPPDDSNPDFHQAAQDMPSLRTMDPVFAVISSMMPGASHLDAINAEKTILLALPLLANLRPAPSGSSRGRQSIMEPALGLVRAVCLYRSLRGLPLNFTWAEDDPPLKGKGRGGKTEPLKDEELPPTNGTNDLIAQADKAFGLNTAHFRLRTHLLKYGAQLRKLNRGPRWTDLSYTDSLDAELLMVEPKANSLR
jgi:hypothetical protein